MGKILTDRALRKRSFPGKSLHYVGLYVLHTIALKPILGWAWVRTAWTRWMFSKVDGTRHKIVFNASGLEVLWRTLVFAIGCAFIIPIPWVLGWFARWYVSQIALAPRAGRKPRPPSAARAPSLPAPR